MRARFDLSAVMPPAAIGTDFHINVCTTLRIPHFHRWGWSIELAFWQDRLKRFRKACGVSGTGFHALLRHDAALDIGLISTDVKPEAPFMADSDQTSEAIISEAEAAAETLHQVKAEIAKAVFGQDPGDRAGPLGHSGRWSCLADRCAGSCQDTPCGGAWVRPRPRQSAHPVHPGSDAIRYYRVRSA